MKRGWQAVVWMLNIADIANLSQFVKDEAGVEGVQVFHELHGLILSSAGFGHFLKG